MFSQSIQSLFGHWLGVRELVVPRLLPADEPSRIDFMKPIPDAQVFISIDSMLNAFIPVPTLMVAATQSPHLLIRSVAQSLPYPSKLVESSLSEYMSIGNDKDSDSLRYIIESFGKMFPGSILDGGDLQDTKFMGAMLRVHSTLLNADPSPGDRSTIYSLHLSLKVIYICIIQSKISICRPSLMHMGVRAQPTRIRNLWSMSG